MNRYLSAGTVCALVVATLLLGGLVLYVRVARQEPQMTAVPGFEKLRPAPTPQLAEIPGIWKGLLAAADAGDRARLRQYLLPSAGMGSAEAELLPNAFCTFMVDAAAAHRAAQARFGPLSPEQAAFFVHHQLDGVTFGSRDSVSAICAVMPGYSENEEPATLTMCQASGRWSLAVCARPARRAAGSPASAIAIRMERAAGVFRAAAADIQAGAYPDAQHAILAIHGDLLRSASPFAAADMTSGL